MKFTKSLVAVAMAALAAGSAFAHDASGNSTVQANGGFNNSISTSAFASGDNSNVQSFAGSANLTAATIKANSTSVSNQPGWDANLGTTHTYSQTNTISATVDTKTEGYAGVIAVNGQGAANMTGWSDGGASGSVNGQLQDMASVTGNGALDVGRPTNALHGPDVTIHAAINGTGDQGASAVGAAGGKFDLGTNATIVDFAGGRSVSLTDTKNVSTYAGTDAAGLNVGGLQNALVGANITQLNAGAEGNVNANGNYNISVTDSTHGNQP